MDLENKLKYILAELRGLDNEQQVLSLQMKQLNNKLGQTELKRVTLLGKQEILNEIIEAVKKPKTAAQSEDELKKAQTVEAASEELARLEEERMKSKATETLNKDNNDQGAVGDGQAQ